MNQSIPTIDTSSIPGQALLGTELGRSVAQLDDIEGEKIGTPSHLHLLQQVINDARKSGFEIITRG